MSEERRRLIYDRAAAGTARFYVVKDAISHAKIYLLERPELRRVIVGFDNDEEAWQHLLRPVRGSARDRHQQLASAGETRRR